MQATLPAGRWRVLTVQQTAALMALVAVLVALALRSPQQFVNGSFNGVIYALFAVGYTLVFGILDILNLAHQAVFMLGAVFTLAILFRLRDHGFPPPFSWLPFAGSLNGWLRDHHLQFAVAMLVAALVCGGIGILLDRVAFRPIRNRTDSNFSPMISSIALALVFEAMVLRQFGPNGESFPFGAFPVQSFEGPGFTITLRQTVIIAISLLLTVGLQAFVRTTRTGRAIRAVAENPRAARLLGVNVDRIILLCFFVSSALGAVAGALYGVEFRSSIEPYMGRGIELKGLAVIILGGMGSIPGALLGGLLLGLTETYTVELLGSGWKDAAAFTILFLILLLRPRGLLGQKAVREA